VTWVAETTPLNASCDALTTQRDHGCILVSLQWGTGGEAVSYVGGKMRGSTNGSTTRRVRVALTAAVAVCAGTAVPHGTASAESMGITDDGGVERISVADDGTQGDGNSVGASITTDGHRIVFASSATNLIAGSTTTGDRVFLRDQQTGQTKRMGAQSPLQPP